mgnify:CR=1 FL=1
MFILFLSCDSIEFQKKDIITNKPIATINNKSLFKEDVASLLPKNVDTKDSIVLIRSISNSWAIQQLLLLRNDEMTMDSLYTHLIYPDSKGKPLEMPLYNMARFDSLTESPLADDINWVGFIKTLTTTQSFSFRAFFTSER